MLSSCAYRAVGRCLVHVWSVVTGSLTTRMRWLHLYWGSLLKLAVTCAYGSQHFSFLHTMFDAHVPSMCPAPLDPYGRGTPSGCKPAS